MRPATSLHRNYRSLEARTPSRTKRLKTDILKTEESSMRTTTKSSMMASIKKAVKNNDLHFLIAERDRIRTEPPDATSLITDQTHNVLVDIRKKHDSAKRDRVEKLRKTEFLKREVAKLRLCEREHRQKLERAKQRNRQNESFLNKLAFTYQSLQQDKDILVYMKERLKADITYYKNSITQSKRKFSHQNFQKDLLLSKKDTIGIQRSNAQQLMRKLEDNLLEENSDRYLHLAQVEAAVEEKNMKDLAERTRHQFENETAQKTQLSKNEEERNWNSLLEVHLFLKRLLKDKIVRQMRKFETVQQSFVAIRAKTEIKTPEEFVERFLNRNAIYGDLVAELARLRDEAARLKRESAQLLEEENQLDDLKKKLENAEYAHIIVSDQGNSYNEHFKWKEKAEANQIMCTSIKGWVSNMLKQMGSKPIVHEETSKFIVGNMKKLLSLLLQAESEVDDSFDLLAVELTPARITRIEESHDVKRELSASEIGSLEDQMEAQREAILAKNSRFMKEVRTKFKMSKLQMLEKQLARK